MIYRQPASPGDVYKPMLEFEAKVEIYKPNEIVMSQKCMSQMGYV
jgi:hypothetical protein